MHDCSIPSLQFYLRQQAIRLREQGKRIGEIAVYLGVHRTTVSGWWRQYQQEGSAALKQQSRGAKLGEGRTLNPTEEAKVQRLIRKHFPDELNIDSALWTRSAVQTLIADECGVEMPIRTVGEYLKRWRYTPQKPLKRAYEQDPQAMRVWRGKLPPPTPLVKAWLETTYPAIEQRALRSDAEIAWADESGLRSDSESRSGLRTHWTDPRNSTQHATS